MIRSINTQTANTCGEFISQKLYTSFRRCIHLLMKRERRTISCLFLAIPFPKKFTHVDRSVSNRLPGRSLSRPLAPRHFLMLFTTFVAKKRKKKVFTFSRAIKFMPILFIKYFVDFYCFCRQNFAIGKTSRINMRIIGQIKKNKERGSAEEEKKKKGAFMTN